MKPSRYSCAPGSCSMPAKQPDRGYPVNKTAPLSYVATMLERARVQGAPVPWDQIRRDYPFHHIPTDLGRVRAAEGLQTDEEAVTWLLDGARAYLAPDIVQQDSGLLLARPLDQLRGPEGEPIHPFNDHIERLDGLFSPLTGGEFSQQTRKKKIRKDTAIWKELRDSLHDFGWLPAFPAIVDEHGVVIDGHRRLQVA